MVMLERLLLVSTSLLVLVSFGCGDDAPAGEDAATAAEVRSDGVSGDGFLETSPSTEVVDVEVASEVEPSDVVSSDAESDLAPVDGVGEALAEVSPDAEEVTPLPTCNGSAVLCDRPFDQVAFVTTHNAMSNLDEGWIAPNQYHGITQQLDDGVRGFMLDTHYWKDDVYLCHGICEAGSELLVEGLAKYTAFLADHPREVITIIFESYISAEDTALAFEESGLGGYVYAHELGTPWPTLDTMIQDDTRVVVLFDEEVEDIPWLLYLWDHAFETHWSAKVPEDFSCDYNRGSPDNALFILNHFLTNPVADPSLASQVNFDPFLVERAQTCGAVYERIPSFVTVDYYSIGDVFEAVAILNGVE